MKLKKLWGWCKALCGISIFLLLAEMIYFTTAYGWRWEPISEAEIICDRIIAAIVLISWSLFILIVAWVVNILLKEDK